jgi:hypothetical protein
MPVRSRKRSLNPRKGKVPSRVYKEKISEQNFSAAGKKKVKRLTQRPKPAQNISGKTGSEEVSLDYDLEAKLAGTQSADTLEEEIEQLEKAGHTMEAFEARRGMRRKRGKYLKSGAHND